MNGFLFIDKPRGPSSFDIIRTLRRATGIQTIGHNGTLDPEASGLLVLAVGNATRVLPYLQSEPKTYLFTMRLGITTDTLDSAGAITEENGIIPSPETLHEAIAHFSGRISQTPPLYSAIKINGKRAYALARQKKTFVMPAKEITIHALDILEYDRQHAEASLRTVCSGGTYIRSLCRDIAEKAGTIGYASSIRRTGIGAFTIHTAAGVDDVKQNLPHYLITARNVLSGLPSYTATQSEIEAISHGNTITLDCTNTGALVFVYDQEHQLAAIAKRVSLNTYHPEKVFCSHGNN